MRAAGADRQPSQALVSFAGYQPALQNEAIHMMRVPQSELDEAIRSIRVRPQYFEPAHLLEEYRKVGLETIPEGIERMGRHAL